MVRNLHLQKKICTVFSQSLFFLIIIHEWSTWGATLTTRSPLFLLFFRHGFRVWSNVFWKDICRQSIVSSSTVWSAETTVLITNTSSLLLGFISDRQWYVAAMRRSEVHRFELWVVITDMSGTVYRIKPFYSHHHCMNVCVWNALERYREAARNHTPCCRGCIQIHSRKLWTWIFTSCFVPGDI